MKTQEIKQGKFRCKFCNKNYPDVLSAYNCNCGKKVKWNNPIISRTTLRPEKSTPQCPYNQFKATPIKKKEFKV